MLKSQKYTVMDVRGVKRAFYGNNTKWTKVSNTYMIDVLNGYAPPQLENIIIEENEKEEIISDDNSTTGENFPEGQA